jgi:hypothetical protein
VRTLRALALASGFTVKTVSEWKTVTTFPVRVDGSYDVWAVCCWYQQQKALTLAKRTATVPEELEPAEGDSPWLERYREARTHRENLKLEQERKNLLPRDLTHQTLMQIAFLLRQAGETLQRQFGEAAHLVLGSALSEADKIIDAVFGPDDDTADDPEPEGAED